MEQKFAFLEKAAMVLGNGKVARQIIALRDIYFQGHLIARRGQRGGWVSSDTTLSQDSWVAPTAVVEASKIVSSIIAGSVKDSTVDNSTVGPNAKVELSTLENTRIFNYSRVSKSVVSESIINDYALVDGGSVHNSCISGNARIVGKVHIYNCVICNAVEVGGFSFLSDCTLKGTASVFEANICWPGGVVGGEANVAFANVFDERTFVKASRDTASGAWLRPAYPDPFVNVNIKCYKNVKVKIL